MRALIIAVLGLALAAFVGCASRPVVSETSTTGTATEPLWVTKGAAAFPEEAGKVFFGVGIAEARYIPAVSLRRKAAIERARGDAAAQLRTMVAAVFKDYTEAAFTPSMDQGEINNLTTNVQRSVVDEVLIGSEPRDVWVNTATGDYYALVAISAESAASQLRATIIEAEKGRLRKESAAAHQELDAIIERYRKGMK